MERPELATAIELLRTVVMEGHLSGQPRIDLSLVQADKRAEYQLALMVTREAVAQGEISEGDLKTALGM